LFLIVLEVETVGALWRHYICFEERMWQAVLQMPAGAAGVTQIQPATACWFVNNFTDGS
jgi:hypothetical protein